MVVENDGVKGVRSPIRFSEAELSVSQRSPHLGEHNGSGFERR
jgi:crotonobetainyl-CoA:carnitine CoA-transferase CaiB-like acyl-CoA transferase